MDMLHKLTETFGPSGNEEYVAELIIGEIKDYVDEVTTDSLGNVIAHKRGSGKKIMLAAHMDEVGVIVTYIEKNGFLRFAPVGGVDCYSLINRRVVFENDTVGVISYESKIDVKKELDFSKMYIDIGAEDADEAACRVSVGDTAVYDSHFTYGSTIAIGKALDNRAGVYALIETIKNVKDPAFDVYYVF
ncbi:MAG: M42 family peptidase, partial [Clostridia bacterium]|nr:M42 family peptidase [Clostridia bacterium]